MDWRGWWAVSEQPYSQTAERKGRKGFVKDAEEPDQSFPAVFRGFCVIFALFAFGCSEASNTAGANR